MNIIVNVSENWAIGKGNSLLFHISGDMKFFKSHTVGNTVVMGRKTLESLPGARPLPNRQNIVLTRNADFEPVISDNLKIMHSIDEFLVSIDVDNSDDIYVIGGESIYATLLPYCKRAYVTKVMDTVTDADAFMVNLDDESDWEISEESETINEKGFDYKFVTYTRK